MHSSHLKRELTLVLIWYSTELLLLKLVLKTLLMLVMIAVITTISTIFSPTTIDMQELGSVTSLMMSWDKTTFVLRSSQVSSFPMMKKYKQTLKISRIAHLAGKIIIENIAQSITRLVM
jgi:hypothetical protein